MKWAKEQKGFTIVELLIVIVVIAILATITVVSYIGVRESADEAKRVADATQVQKSIQASALTNNKRALSIKPPLVYTSDVNKQAPFTKAITGAREITMYFVFDTTGTPGVDYTGYIMLQPLVSARNYIALRHSTGTSVGSRIDTSSQTNTTTVISAGAISASVGRHVGWVATLPTKYEVNYDNSAVGSGYNLTAHDGWNFNAVEMRSNNNFKGVAALVFDEYHDQSTRRQVIDWLDRKHDINFYN